MPEKKALTKSTCLVNWCYIQEAKQAVELIEKWEAIDVADALELLPPDSENLEASYLAPLCILPFFLDVYVIRCPHIFLDLFMQKTFCWSYTYFVSPFLLFSELCGCSGVSHDFFCMTKENMCSFVRSSYLVFAICYACLYFLLTCSLLYLIYVPGPFLF